MLGIETDGPGFKRLVMKPEVGHSVTWAKGHYDSIMGRIESDWRIEDDQLIWRIAVPANTTATLHVPAPDASSVTEADKPLEQDKAVRFVRMQDGRAVLEVGSGTYLFRSAME